MIKGRIFDLCKSIEQFGLSGKFLTRIKTMNKYGDDNTEEDPVEYDPLANILLESLLFLDGVC